MLKRSLDFFRPQEKREQVYRIIFLLVILLGVAFRARHYLAGRSLWLDEAMLALDVSALPFGALTQQPLPYQQAAPIGFLFVTKAFTLLFGDSEFAFRLYSFGAGLLALGLLGWLAWRYLGKWGALLATGLFASGQFLIYYAAENKQYGGDVAVTLVLLVLLMRVVEGEFSARRFLLFAAASNVLLWFSHPAVFSIAATGIVLAIHFWRAGEKRAFRWALGALAVTGSNALLMYWFHLRPIGESDFLRSFWEVAFMTLPPTWAWAKANWIGILKNPLGIEHFHGLYFGFFLAGILFLWRKKWQLALTLLLILAFLLGTAALQKYPLAERMMLFAAPVYLLFFGAGLDGLHEGFTKLTAGGTEIGERKVFALIPRNQLVTLFFVFLIVGLGYDSFHRAFERFRAPLYREHIRPSLTYLRDHLRKGDQIYLYHFTEPAFRFYLPKYGFEELDYIVGGNYISEPTRYLTEIDNLKLQGRVWFLFSHVYEVATINEEDFITAHLDELGEQKALYRAPGASVSLYLYKFP